MLFKSTGASVTIVQYISLTVFKHIAVLVEVDTEK